MPTLIILLFVGCGPLLLAAEAQGNVYKIVNVRSGRCLDANNGSRANGANVQQFEDNGTMAQQWHFVRIG